MGNQISNFPAVLTSQLSAKATSSDTAEFAQFRENLIGRVFNSPHQARRELVLAALEHRARLAVKLPEVGAVDWSLESINWTAIFAALVQFLPLLLTIFGL
jgi:hypothetical protein